MVGVEPNSRSDLCRCGHDDNDDDDDDVFLNSEVRIKDVVRVRGSVRVVTIAA